jgi:PTH1 family peptidyl-tRNA hydrolase
LKYLLVGLGNVGEEYLNTRHNIGFDIVDEFLKKHSPAKEDASFVLSRHAFKAETKWKGKTIHVIKPTTFMNLSGKAVNYWINELKVPLTNVLVVIDDLAFPFGKIKLKAAGSDAGHNGIRHINDTLGTSEYARLRFGIHSPFPRGQQIDFVLGHFDKEEAKQLPELVSNSVTIIQNFIALGIEKAMSQKS